MFSKISILSFLLFTFLLFSIEAQAVAPVNNNFSSAQLISGASGNILGTNVEATKQSGEPAHALNTGGASIWYKYVATGNGVMKVESTGIDTLLAVYRGGSVNNLTELGSCDDFNYSEGGGSYSIVYFGTKTGETYYIAVDGKDNDGSGAVVGNINFTFEFSNAMANDSFAGALGLAPSAYGSITRTVTNVGASKEVGEPDHAGNAGGKSIWFKLVHPGFEVPRSISLTLEGKTTFIENFITSSALAVYTGASVNSLTEVASRSVCYFCANTLTFIAQPNTTYYIAIDGYDLGSGVSTSTYTLSHGLAKNAKTADFDRDGKADLTVYRPSTGVWYSRDSVTGNARVFQWGTNGDKPLISDQDGDGKQDYQIYRPDTGTWYQSSSFGQPSIFNWGVAADIPMTLKRVVFRVEYSYAVVFRPGTGTWWLKDPFYGDGLQFSIPFGLNGDIPMTADFDGDGTDEIAVFRPSTGVWYIANPFTGQVLNTVQWGINGDKPVAADYDNDGKADIAVYRPSTGTWYIMRSMDGTYQYFKWGLAADKPQPADYDNDGKTDFAVFRPSEGNWYIRESQYNDPTVKIIHFGTNGDIPVTVPMQ